MIRALCCCLVAISVALAAPVAAQTEAKPKAKKSSKAPPPSPQKTEFNVTRTNLVFAARTCVDKPASCSEELLHDSESRFLKACNACTGMEDCRSEVKAIKAGEATKGFDPCK
jgi:hypothetical protein